MLSIGRGVRIVEGGGAVKAFITEVVLLIAVYNNNSKSQPQRVLA